MPEVLILSKYGFDGASSRQRFLQFIPSLEEYGFRVTVAPFFDEGYVKRLYGAQGVDKKKTLGSYFRRIRLMLLHHPYDLIWVEKEFLPWMPNWMERAAYTGTPYVVDFDDAWSLRYETHKSALIRAAVGRKFDGILRHAAGVVVGNAVLEAWAKDRGAGTVERVPTVVDCRGYSIRPPPDGPFTIGWIGTPVTTPYLKLVHDALRTIASRTSVRLRIIGAPSFSMDGVPVDARPWTAAQEADDLANIHVGIMPLSDGPWERGKCGYKLIQYMAAGRPVIASPVGANVDIVRTDNTVGFLASTTEAWIEALEWLRTHPRERKTMGMAARRRAEAEYSIAAQEERLMRFLSAAATGGAMAENG